MSNSPHLTRKLLLAGTVLTSIAFAAPVFAQDTTAQPATTQDATTPPAATDTPPPPAAKPADDGTTVVITGSRIRKNEFNSDAPVQVITAEKSSLSGMISATQVLQSTSVANGSGQINSTFTGFVVDGGDGINTLSLRGLGAQRSLILLNGRRMPPAGVSGTVGPVDLNFIPQSMVQRYEILKDGASSIYGSDAVAGVVNIITVKNFDGFRISADGRKSDQSGGDQYSANAMWGKTFDKGNILVSADYFEQSPLTLAQRKDLSCPQLYRYKPDGSRADPIDPSTGTYKCFNSTGVFQGDVFDNIYGNTFFYKNGSNDPNGFPNYIFYDGTNSALEDDTAPEANSTDAISPSKRYSIFAQGQYSPDWLNGGQLYSEVMLAERKSSQTSWGELFPFYSSESSVNPIPNFVSPDDALFYDSIGIDADGPALPLAQPVALHPFNSSQKVDLGRVLGGVRGDLGKWQYDAYLSYSKSVGKYDDQVMYADRVNWGTGFDQVNFTDVPECGAGAPAGCVPLNLFTDDALTKGKLTPAEEAYYFTVDHGRTDYSQLIAEATLTGDLIQLPAGPLGTAVGVSFRRDKIDDLPGVLSRTSNSYNRSSSGETKGTDDLSEAFGEFEIPVIRGVPLIEDLTLNLSGRYSDYKSVGSATTYKAGFNWALDNTLRLRGTAGTSFRAPALYELFLNDQTGFLSQLSVDPCIRYDQKDDEGNFKVNDTVRANCAADGILGNYTGNGSSAEVITGGGLDLKPETSYATTLGFVLTPPNLGFKFAVDWWKIKIAQQITANGAAVVGACYNSQAFRSQAGFCDDFVRDPDSHNITTIDGSYRNIPTESETGIDFTANFQHEFNYGTLTSDWQFSYYKDHKSESYPGGPVIDVTGTIGDQHWAGDVQTRFRHKDWTATWTYNYVGDASNIGFQGETGVTSSGNTYTASVPPFITHDLTLRYSAKTYEVIVGVDNVFNKFSPIIGSGVYSGSAGRLGNGPFSSQYFQGIIGREFFLHVSKDF